MIEKYDHLLHGVDTFEEACNMGTDLLEKHLDFVITCTVCDCEVDQHYRGITITNCARALRYLDNKYNDVF